MSEPFYEWCFRHPVLFHLACAVAGLVFAAIFIALVTR